MGRAVVLLAVAVVIGVVLLRHNGTSSGRIVSTSQSQAGPATTAKPPNTTPPTASRATTSSTMPLRAPQDIKVLVANGTSTNGLASTVKSKLQGEGYQTLTSTNASEPVTATIIYYRSGYQNEAAAMAQFLNLSPTAVQAMPAQAPVANPTSASAANIIVVAGPDLAQGGTTGTSGTGGTTTTSPARTTTTISRTTTTIKH